MSDVYRDLTRLFETLTKGDAWEFDPFDIECHVDKSGEAESYHWHAETVHEESDTYTAIGASWYVGSELVEVSQNINFCLVEEEKHTVSDAMKRIYALFSQTGETDVRA